MPIFREEVSGEPSEPSPSSVINAIDANIKENKLILTDENGKIITLTLTEDALKQLPDELSSTSSSGERILGGSRRRKSRKHKVVKRRNKSRRRHRRN